MENVDKKILWAKREEFFNDIIHYLQQKPLPIDYLLNQANYYLSPDMNNSISNSEYGDMAICVNGEFFGKQFKVYYTVWQLSDVLRIGVNIADEDLQTAFSTDNNNEIFYIWGHKNDPKINILNECIFYDWEFEVPQLYESYREQEKFILGMRHMHFRVLRVIHDACQSLAAYNSESLTDSINDFSQTLNINASND